MVELLPDRIRGHGSRLAIVDPGGEHVYADLDATAHRLAARLLGERDDLDGDRVALLCRPGRDFVVGLLGGWLAGALVVPLHPDHPVAELEYSVRDAGVTTVVASESMRPLVSRLAATVPELVVLGVSDVDESTEDGRRAGLPALEPDRPALMVYTSGTTGRPKGAVHSHGSIAAQIAGMVELWRWSSEDRVLLVLPLHHVHGIVNVTLCALWQGATCEAPGGFDATEVWERLASGAITLFMAVPTIYARLTKAWDDADGTTRQRWSSRAAHLRLMVCGSAALPVVVLDRWESITGHRLLERYGMTELGMVLSNSLEHRVPGHVGFPMPGAAIRVVDDQGHDVASGEAGELLVRGPQVFLGYWDRPEATAETFVDGWFRTGDVAVETPEGFRLLGRASVDILKTGGEKVSALEIEEAFRRHPAVADCAVVGIPDDEWGQRVGIAIVPAGAPGPDPVELRAWGKEQLAAAKVPTRWLVLDELPRNAMGKVTKPALIDRFHLDGGPTTR